MCDPQKTYTRIDRWELAGKIDRAFEYEKWITEIPVLVFAPYMRVRVIPPFGGAVVRFLVSHKDYPDASVSVYLDCYDLLAYMGEPYWEVYPYQDDVERVPMKDVEKLMVVIEESLREQVERR